MVRRCHAQVTGLYDGLGQPHSREGDLTAALFAGFFGRTITRDLDALLALADLLATARVVEEEPRERLTPVVQDPNKFPALDLLFDTLKSATERLRPRRRPTERRPSGRPRRSDR
jgi:hypothetical protein